MMGVERRKGKDVPVITKALVDLKGDNFKGYCAVRDKWAILDCYKCPGPVQFKGPNSHAIPHIVLPIPMEKIIRETDEAERYELERVPENHPFNRRPVNNLSRLCQARITEEIPIPTVF